MSPARLASAAGILLLVTSCALPGGVFAYTSFAYVPYQDATPELAQKQAQDIADAQHAVAVSAWIAGALAVLGVVALVYARRQVRSRNTGPQT